MLAIQNRDQAAMRNAARQRALALDWAEIGRRTRIAYER
jgi:hypothetical protein